MNQTQRKQAIEHAIDAYVRATFQNVCRFRNDQETLETWLQQNLHEADLPEPVKRLLIHADRAARAHNAYALPTHDGIY